MKRNILTLIFAIILSTLVYPAKAEKFTFSEKESIANAINQSPAIDGKKKRKLKKRLRQSGRLYRVVKSDKKDRKKSRKVQRKVRRVINIF